MMAIIHSLECTVPFSFRIPLLSLAVAHCHSLSLFVTRCTTRCHSLSLVVPLVVTRCHSLSLVVPLVVTRCHSLSLVVTRCNTRLSFYKRSEKTIFVKSLNHPSAFYLVSVLTHGTCFRLFNLISCICLFNNFLNVSLQASVMQILRFPEQSYGKKLHIVRLTFVCTKNLKNLKSYL